MSGFEDLAKSFKRLDDENSAEWREYAPMMKKIVADANAAAQSKGLCLHDVALLTAGRCGAGTAVCGRRRDCAQVRGRDFGRACRQVPQCGAHDHQGTGVRRRALAQPAQEKAEEICLMLIEASNGGDAVLDPVVKGFDSKTPKVVAACAHVVALALAAFGPKIASPKLYMKVRTCVAQRLTDTSQELPKLFGHTDKLVRDEVCVPLWRLRAHGGAGQGAGNRAVPVDGRRCEDQSRRAEAGAAERARGRLGCAAQDQGCPNAHCPRRAGKAGCCRRIRRRGYIIRDDKRPSCRRSRSGC